MNWGCCLTDRRLTMKKWLKILCLRTMIWRKVSKKHVLDLIMIYLMKLQSGKCREVVLYQIMITLAAFKTQTSARGLIVTSISIILQATALLLKLMLIPSFLEIRPSNRPSRGTMRKKSRLMRWSYNLSFHLWCKRTILIKRKERYYYIV